MKINLITVDNGVGLTQDVRVVKSILKDHDCRFIDIEKGPPETADVNIFFEIIHKRFYPYAGVNLFFPNPEWFWFRGYLKGLDLVLCKTRDAERIFKQLGCNTVYTSFTSEDRRRKAEKQRKYLHLAGQSQNKGTMEVFRAWNNQPLPELVFCKTKAWEIYANHSKNITGVFTRMPDKVLLNLLNACYFHICTSDYEGFGHYIWEAKSCGGIVITTDGEPMSDFVHNGIDGFTVQVARYGRQQLAETKRISVEKLREVVHYTANLTDGELEGMSRASRQAWEENDRFFKTIFRNIILEVYKWC